MVVGRGDVQGQSQVRLDELPEEIRDESDDTMDRPTYGDVLSTPPRTSATRMSYRVCRSTTSAGRNPPEAQPTPAREHVTEQHAAPPLPRTARTYASCRATVLRRAPSPWRRSAQTVRPIVRLTRKAIGATIDTLRRGWEADDEAGTGRLPKRSSRAAPSRTRSISSPTEQLPRAGTARRRSSVPLRDLRDESRQRRNASEREQRKEPDGNGRLRPIQTAESGESVVVAVEEKAR